MPLSGADADAPDVRDTGTLSTLGTEHGQPVMLTWNTPPVPRP